MNFRLSDDAGNGAIDINPVNRVVVELHRRTVTVARVGEKDLPVGAGGDVVGGVVFPAFEVVG